MRNVLHYSKPYNPDKNWNKKSKIKIWMLGKSGKPAFQHTCMGRESRESLRLENELKFCFPEIIKIEARSRVFPPSSGLEPVTSEIITVVRSSGPRTQHLWIIESRVSSSHSDQFVCSNRNLIWFEPTDWGCCSQSVFEPMMVAFNRAWLIAATIVGLDHL